jgi:ribonuclease-3 family protein
MGMGFLESMSKEFNPGSLDVNQYSPLVLAYIGDTVYEIYVRTLVVRRGNAPVHVLHKSSVKYVKAKTQSDIIHRIMDFLSQEEQDIVRRGRNAKSGTIPKNADVTEYKYATGFESLLGYLYLKGDHQRLMQILKMATESVQDGE